ncbi:MAG: GerMN domain-containing protein [Lachnospiraceae bacterium]|nr:GerMN domain-containing protein [Lachnospiraceae bacterium]
MRPILKSKTKKCITSLLTLLLAVLLTGCGPERKIPDNAVIVYYLTNDMTGLEMRYREVPHQDAEARLASLLTCLSETPERLEYKAPLAMGFSLKSHELDNGFLTMDFTVEYRSLQPAEEVLVRAAIVRTLLQEESVSKIFFKVEGESLKDALGTEVGWMDSSTFISNDGNEINTYEEVKVRLYFTNETGSGLIGADREKFYLTSIPLERFVVEEVIKGPSGQVPGLYPTVNSATGILSVSTRDGICYVNLDSNFLTTPENVSTEIAIYSIVNSLTELSGVEKVQILVDGQILENFPSTSFEKREDLLTTLEQVDS